MNVAAIEYGGDARPISAEAYVQYVDQLIIWGYVRMSSCSTHEVWVCDHTYADFPVVTLLLAQ